MNELLRDTPFYDKVVVSTMEDHLGRIRDRHMGFAINGMMFVFPAFALVFVIIVQYACLFLTVYAKQAFVKGLMGHNPFRIFLRLLLESNVAVLAAIGVALYSGVDFRLLLVVICLDLLVYMAVVLFSQDRQSRLLELGES